MAVVYELKTIAIQLCVTRLMELGLEEEGLFRLSAGQAKVDMSKLLIISTLYVIRNKNDFEIDQQVKRLRAEIEAGQVSSVLLLLCVCVKPKQ